MPHGRVIPPQANLAGSGSGSAKASATVAVVPPLVATDGDEKTAAVKKDGSTDDGLPSNAAEVVSPGSSSTSPGKRTSRPLASSITAVASNTKNKISHLRSQLHLSPFKAKVGRSAEGKEVAHELVLDGTSPSHVWVTVDTLHSHTIRWDADISEVAEMAAGDDGGDGGDGGGGGAAAVDAPSSSSAAGDADLPAGSCTFYLFPTTRTAREPRGSRPSPAGLRVLAKLVVALGSATDALLTPDGVGAYAVHALMVCNTEESLALALELFEAYPPLLTQLHVRPSAPSAPISFVGESSLHIAAVNKREAVLVRLVELAHATLPTGELEALLRAHAVGSFFAKAPMLYYGGTALSYACIFELREAIVAMLATGAVSFNAREHAGCVISGFLPLHAIVANGMLSMYDFVTAELPHEWRADATQRTRTGRSGDASLRLLTGMQLAAKLGDHRMFRHILRKQCNIDWVWGPVTQFSLNLEGIDSAGEGGSDIMELITRMDAQKGTTEMLLDNFMNGFIHRLFEKKWRLYGARVHYAKRCADAALLVLVVYFSFTLKFDASSSSPAARGLAVAILAVAALIVAEEGRTAVLFAANEQGVGDMRLPPRELLRLVLQFLRLHAVHLQLVGMLCTAAACAVLLSAPPSGLAPPAVAALVHANGTITFFDDGGGDDGGVGRRQLRSRGGGDAVIGLDEDTVVWDEGGAWSGLWLLLSLGQLLLMLHFAFVAFMPFEKLNILLLSIKSMLLNDVAIFLVAYSWCLLAFFLGLFTLYPRSAGRDFPVTPTFNDASATAQAILELAFIGEAFKVDLDLIWPVLGRFHPLTSLALFSWFGVYLFFVIVTLILLINLLIAMLTNTYETVRESQKLQSRLSFAQCVIKLELIATSLRINCKVGEVQPDGTYHYVFRSLDRDTEEESEDGYPGDIEDGGVDPFQDPAPDRLARIEQSLASLTTVVLRSQAAASGGSGGGGGDGDGGGGDGGGGNGAASGGSDKNLRAQLRRKPSKRSQQGTSTSSLLSHGSSAGHLAAPSSAPAPLAASKEAIMAVAAADE